MPNHQRAMKYILLFIFAIILNACTDRATTQPIHQTQEKPKVFTAETKTPTKISATLEPTPTYPSTVKPKERYTPLPRPWDAPDISPPDTLAATVESIPSETPALPLKGTQFASFAVTCGVDGLNDFYTSLSPKGNWLAISCGYKRNQTLQIYNKTSKKWELQFKDYVSKQFIENGEAPMGRLYPERWTLDEKYLYFGSSIGFDMGGTCFYGGSGQGLYRINVDDGTVSATLPPLSGFEEYIISFSPKGRWVAYYTYSGIPTILDLQTGEDIIFEEGMNDVGDLFWSPDGSKLAYSTCEPSEDHSLIKRSSIRIFSMETRESKTILESNAENMFLRIKLGDSNILRIYDDHANDPNYSFFDWSIERLITPTLTPTP